jgi:hypothetical protein
MTKLRTDSAKTVLEWTGEAGRHAALLSSVGCEERKSPMTALGRWIA